MENLQVEAVGYNQSNTGFLEFIYSTASHQKIEFEQLKYYVYNFIKEDDVIDYKLLEEMTKINRENLKVIVHRIKCRLNGIK